MVDFSTSIRPLRFCASPPNGPKRHHNGWKTNRRNGKPNLPSTLGHHPIKKAKQVREENNKLIIVMEIKFDIKLWNAIKDLQVKLLLYSIVTKSCWIPWFMEDYFRNRTDNGVIQIVWIKRASMADFNRLRRLYDFKTNSLAAIPSWKLLKT